MIVAGLISSWASGRRSQACSSYTLRPLGQAEVVDVAPSVGGLAGDDDGIDMLARPRQNELAAEPG
jgi:hypothetical protein